MTTPAALALARPAAAPTSSTEAAASFARAAMSSRSAASPPAISAPSFVPAAVRVTLAQQELGSDTLPAPDRRSAVPTDDDRPPNPQAVPPERPRRAVTAWQGGGLVLAIVLA